jgi:hypothetical protein
MLDHDSSIPFRRLFEGGIKTAPKHNEKVERALTILRKASKLFLKQGRYLALHWNRGSIIYSTWDTLGEIPGQHMALWVNTFFKKVLKIPLGTPIFVFGASIDSAKSVPKELIEGYKAITVKELFPDVLQTTPEGFLLQGTLGFTSSLHSTSPIHASLLPSPLFSHITSFLRDCDFQLRTCTSFGYFATNFWSTFDDEVSSFFLFACSVCLRESE